MVTEHGTPVAIVLRCPECGRELPGLDADRVWTCAPCARAWEIDGARLAPRPFCVWRPPGGPAAESALRWLPFWRVAYRIEVDCPEPPLRDAILRAAASGRAWVRAFRLDGAFQVGDPGQVLTEGDHAEHLEAAGLPECVGARLGSAEAVNLARLFLLARADREIDVTPAEVRLEATETALVAVPFAEDGRDLVCAIDARSYRRSAMGDLG
jgi:hypothetical protein